MNSCRGLFMAYGLKLFICFVSFSAAVFAKNELTIQKFRFKHHSSTSFERMVVEFSGPSVDSAIEIKTNATRGKERDLSVLISNVQLTGAIPESAINESYQNKKEWSGPLSFNVDSPKNGFSIRTLLKNPQHELDAFWLSHPTRLVMDVYPKDSLRAGNREVLAPTRSVASAKMTKKSSTEKKKTPSLSESIFCFPAASQMDAAIAFEPYQGNSMVRVDVEAGTTPVTGKQKDGIVCYPAHTRVHPQVSFDPAPEKKPSDSTEPDKADAVKPEPTAMNAEAPMADPVPAMPSESSVGSKLLPVLPPVGSVKMEEQANNSSSTGAAIPSSSAPSLLPPTLLTQKPVTPEDQRLPASQAVNSQQFNPKAVNSAPSSLGSIFVKPGKGANPAQLLPPFKQ